MIILDNFRSHHSKAVKESAESLNIKLIFLPPYSPDLNPIEFIWKSVKRSVSIATINSENDLKSRIKDPKGYEVLLDIISCGVCHSNLHMIEGGFIIFSIIPDILIIFSI